jgi:hypothetical protein
MKAGRSINFLRTDKASVLTETGHSHQRQARTQDLCVPRARINEDVSSICDKRRNVTKAWGKALFDFKPHDASSGEVRDCEM